MANPADELHSDPLLFTAPTFEGFKVLEPAVLYARVGAGGMGAVYRGRHVSLECDVAVKVLKADLAHDTQFVLRFEREAKLAARIKNDNVVQVLDVRHKNGIHYLVMEFVKGETARERVKRKGKLKEKEALAIVLGAARGLRAAHAESIVHRDIKPENVLIAVDGAVKLADLGLAKSRQSSGEQSMTMLSSGVMGTPQYMPPEQWRSPDVTPAADVWSLGATLYFLLVGRSAIEAGELLAIADRIRDQDFPKLPDSLDVRPEVREILAKCTRRNPEERYADARELTRALQPLVDRDDDDVLADSDSGSRPSQDAMVTPPPRATLAKIKVQIASEAEGDGTQGWDGPPPPSEQPTMPRPSQRSQPGVGSTRVPTPGPVTATQVAVPPRGNLGRTLVVVALIAAGAVGGYGYQQGWFAPRTTTPITTGQDEPTIEQKPSEPNLGAYKSGRPLVSGDANAKGQAALARGVAAMPLVDGLDTAIAAFEEALEYDRGLDAARRNLVLARAQKAKSLEAKDPDAAWLSLELADRLSPNDPACVDVRARVAAALQQRLQRGLSLTEPATDAVLAQRAIRVVGSMVAAGCKQVHVALDTRPDAASQPFPRSASETVPVVAGSFDTKLIAAADGAALIRVEAEDMRSLVAEIEPRPIVVDTVPPELTIDTPAELDLVPAKVSIAGRVKDASAVTVTVNATPAKVTPEGAFVAVVTLADQLQKVEVVARDAAGSSTQRSLDLRVDARAPVLTLAQSSPLRTTAPRVELQGRVEDDGKVALTWNGASLEIAADGSFAATAEFTAAGEQVFTLVAVDAFGQESKQTIRVLYEPEPTVVGKTPIAPEEKPVEQPAEKPAENRDVKAARLAPDPTSPSAQKPTPGEAPGDAPIALSAWADAATDAREVLVGDRKVPSVVVDRQTGMRMVLVVANPTGFQMGSPASEAERSADEVQHRCVIEQPFWLGETEVTQAQWQKVMGNNPSTQQGADNPVEGVSWEDCQQFVQKLNAGPGGGGFRLPSEGEWEYACRAGTTTAFSFGDRVAGAQINFDGSNPYNGAPKTVFRDRTLPVRSLPPNAFGLYDMHGNVSEWCEDTYGPYAEIGSEQPARGSGQRVMRGGAFDNSPSLCRSAIRFNYPAQLRSGRTGLRLCRSWQ